MQYKIFNYICGMTRDELFTIIPAKQFFTKYAPQVKRFYHKLNGTDGNKQPIDFTNEDKSLIKEGVKKLREDLKKVKL